MRLLLAFLLFFCLNSFSQVSTDNLVVWYNADSISISSGNNIDTLYDISGNNYHAFQDNLGNQPVFEASGLDGNQSILFDGNDVLNTPSLSLNTTEVFFICKGFDVSNKYFGFGNGYYVNFLTTGRSILYLEGSNFRYFNPLQDNNIMQLHNFGFVDGVADNINTFIRINTEDLEVANGQVSGYFTLDNLKIGGGALNGYISEILVYDTILSSDQRNEVENYLMNKYAPPFSFSVDTIYRNSFCDTCFTVEDYYDSILWSTGQTTQTLCIDKPGFYWVDLYDVFGRHIVDSVHIEYFDIEIENSIVCIGDSIKIKPDFSNDFTLEWYNGSSADSIFIDSSGEFWVKVTDSDLCSDTSFFNVLVDSFPVRDLFEYDTIDLCSGNELPISDEVGFIESYFWMPGSFTDSVFNVANSGWHYLTAINSNNCAILDSIYVNVIGVAPTPQFEIVDTCFGTITSFIDQTQPADSVAKWMWIFNNNDSLFEQNPQYLFSDTGMNKVELIVESFGNCSNSIIKYPIIKPVSIPLFEYYLPCSNNESLFTNLTELPTGNSIVDFEWEIDDQIVSTDTNLVYVFEETGTYKVRLRSTLSNGCVNEYLDSISVESYYPLPEFVDLISPLDNYINFSDSVEFVWNNYTEFFIYNLIISADSSFNDVISTYSLENQSSHTIEYPLLYDTIYWRLDIVNTCGDYISSRKCIIKNYDLAQVSTMKAWYNADSIIESGLQISQLYDLSGNENHATQTEESEMPVFELNNGLANPGIKFNGGQNLNTPDFNLSDVEIIGIIEGFDIANKIFGFGNGYWVNFNAFNDRSIVYLNSNNYQYYSSEQFDSVPLIHNFSILDGFANCDSCFLELNGNRQSKLNSANTTPFTLNDLNIGANSLNGIISEILVFDSLLDEKDRYYLRYYLSQKYAPPVNLLYNLTIPYGFPDTTITTANKPWFTSYQWNTSENDTLSTLNVSEPGTYAVTVTDIFGFESSDSLKVRYPEFNLWEDRSICLGDTLTWDLDAKGPYSYEWSTGATDTAIQVFEAGTYTVTLTDTAGNQWSPDTVVITVDSFPVNATLGPDLTLCAGNRLELETGQDEAVGFLWHDGSTLPYYRIDVAEEISVQVTNQLGCVAYDTIQVDVAGTAPKADFAFGTTCRDAAVQFTDLSVAYDGAIIDSYGWEFGEYGSSSEQNPAFAFTDTGYVEVALFIETNEGCDNDTTLTIDIHELPEAGIANSRACENATVQMNHTSVSVDGELIDFQWEVEEQLYQEENPFHTFTNAGTIDVQLITTTEYDCKDTVFQQITIKPAPVADFIYDVACIGEPVYFTNLTETNLYQQYSSQWQFGNSGISNNQNPSYTFDTISEQLVQLIVRQLADGCTDTLSKIVQIHNLPVAAISEQTGCEGIENVLFHNSSWGEGEFEGSVLWQFADTAFVGNTPVLAISEAGTYPFLLRVKNAAGCEDTVGGEYIINESPGVSFAQIGDTTFYPTVINLENTSDPAQWNWFINDESFSSNQNPELEIDTAGLYIIRLHAVNENGCEGEFIDSTLALAPFIDGGITECRAIISEGKLYVSVDLINMGTKSVTNPELRLTLSNGQMFAETMTGNFYPGEEKTYTFRTQYFIPDGEQLRWLSVELNYAQDQALGNNECTYVFGDEPIIYPPYPNPAGSFIKLDFTATQDGKMRIKLINLMGQIVLDETREVSIGLNRVEIPNPAPGGSVHTMEVEVNGKRETFRIIL